MCNKVFCIGITHSYRNHWTTRTNTQVRAALQIRGLHQPVTCCVPDIVHGFFLSLVPGTLLSKKPDAT